MSGGTMDVRRGADRGLGASPGIVTRHSFSFGHHHEPGNTHHGLLLAHNEDRIAPGAGYDEHPHRDTEIVTWVLTGTLEHTDDAGRTARVTPGTVQRLSAGRGVVHTERNAGDDELHLVQMWLVPDVPGTEPSYARHDVGPDLADGSLVAVAGGAGPVGLGTAAVFHVARPRAGTRVELPAARRLHVFVARGEAVVGDLTLHPGDAVRAADTTPTPLTATTDAEILVWEMHEDLVPDEGERP
ncbi:pirin family protein [Actinomycetospora atypica]|uniref:Pirin family protein n=1 Tax=Actinomycetospora atypica TaxID=1290095 RepID=A0ABV9YRM4_9PSEU